MALNSTDLKVLSLAQDDGNIFTRYYLSGFEYQEWQRLLHHAAQPNLVVVGGVGSGKTCGVGVSASNWAAMLPFFAFMDVAPTSWQATLMYADILRRAEAGTYADKFIKRVARKPYPIIELHNGSTLEFMTAQDDIAKLRGWEGDWMHGDEFGFINTFATTIAIMRTRLRGKTPDGRRARIGRLTVTTTSTDNPELWARFDRMYEDPRNYLSFTVRSDQNPHLSKRDLELMYADIPEEIRAVEMDGERPIGRGVFFPLHVIQACEDASLNDMCHRATEDGQAGFVYEEDVRHGLLRYQLPYVPGREYLVVGDPGLGNPPHRNAGAIGVFDITGMPYTPGSEAVLVAFAWVAGHGRYEPFEHQFKTWWEYYRCGFNSALESTGPQKSFSEYAFTMGLQGQEMWVDGIDMSGNKKNEALQATIQLFQRGKIRIPFSRSMRNQLVSYILPDTKIAQDIVSMFMTAAAWLRQYRFWAKDMEDKDPEQRPAFSPYGDDPRAVRAEPLQQRPR